MVHVYHSLYIVRCMMLIIVLVPFRPLLLWHSVSLPDEVGEIAMAFKHWCRSTPHIIHQLACGPPPACRCGTSFTWAIARFRSSSLVGLCLKSEFAALMNSTLLLILLRSGHLNITTPWHLAWGRGANSGRSQWMDTNLEMMQWSCHSQWSVCSLSLTVGSEAHMIRSLTMHPQSVHYSVLSLWPALNKAYTH